MDQQEIRKLARRLDIRDTVKVSQQNDDQTYYEDKFKVKIVTPFHVIRTGTASKIIHNIVSHIQLSNPQVFREPRKHSEKSRESALKVSRLLNYWIKEWIPEIYEIVWDDVLYGEGIGQIDFNNEAYGKTNDGYVYKGDATPIKLTSVNPLITHCLPYDALNPLKVIKSFEIDCSELTSLYSEWSNPKKRLEGSSTGAKYLSYWDDKQKYFEADGEDLSNVQQNIFGFCPFVHFYAGWGKRSADGKPETLAIGRLKDIRGRLEEECEIESRIDSIIGLYANPILQIMKTANDADEADRAELEKTVLGPGATIVTPYGWNQVIYTPAVANAQLFSHLAQVRDALEVDNPSLLSGAPIPGATGRREDIEYEHIKKRYAKLVQNLERGLGVLLGMGLRIIDTMPQGLPVLVKGTVFENGEVLNTEEQITKEDIDGFYDCTVVLNPDEEMENDRDFSKYRMLVNEGKISWKEFLIKGCKKTESEAEDIMAEAIAEQTIMTNPQMQDMRVQEALKQMGATKYLDELKAQGAQTDKMNQALQTQQSLQPQKPKGYRPSEARNPLAAGIIRQVLGESPKAVRNPPTGVTNAK